jgi:phytoene dehydrogenase-like protein
MNGYQAHIFETQDQPGGVVTSWKRRGYLFDGCIEFLNGSNPRSHWHRMWLELGAAQGRRFVEHSEFIRVRDSNGKELIFYADVDQLEQHLLSLSPGDERVIHALAGDVRAMAAFYPPLDSNLLAMLPEMPRAMKWLNTFNKHSKTTISAFAERFKDPFLRETFPYLMPPGIPMGMAIGTLAFNSQRNNGYPVGGSLAFAQAIARRFCSLGGEIHFRSKVEKILVESRNHGKGGQATGVRLADRREFPADWVISASDGYSTIYRLLDGKFVDAAVENRYTRLVKSRPCVQVSLGINRDLSGEPHSQVDLLSEPISFAGEDHPFMWYQIFHYDPTLAPDGKSIILSRIRSNYSFWKLLEDHPSRYEDEKQAAAEGLLRQLDKRYPGIRRDVECLDVTTPLTYERYTGNQEGVYQSFAVTPENVHSAVSGLPPTLPGLEGFYQVGQWVLPNGGVFPAARSGREVVKKLCKADRNPFITSVP